MDLYDVELVILHKTQPKALPEYSNLFRATQYTSRPAWEIAEALCYCGVFETAYFKVFAAPVDD